MSTNHSGTLNLIRKQKYHFPRILEELKTQGRKVSHWAWYVWPTSKAGNSEPYPKTWVTKPNAEALLQQTNLSSWIQILHCINELLAQNSNSFSYIIPPTDHGRIHYFLGFWLSEVREVTNRYPDFKAEVIRFSQHVSAAQ